MRRFANPRMYVAVLLVALSALVGATSAGNQQRQGAPFSTAIAKLKEGLIVHTGDLVVWGKRSQGTTLTPNMDYAEGHGSGKEWVATLDALLALDFDTAIPGHGPVLTKDDVRVFRNKMQTLNERMAAFVAGGGKRSDIPARIKLDDLDWPFPPDALSGLYDEWARH